MFWNFLLAHFLGDYPLQNTWMVTNKTRLPALVLHAGVHFALLLLVISPAWLELWPFCLLLAAAHFFIDLGKTAFSKIKPDWVALPYLIDQCLHYLTLAVVAWWIAQTHGSIFLVLNPGTAILITGYLLATHVWAISEKVLTSSQPEYRQELVDGFWPRMVARALLLTGLLLLLYPGPRGVAAVLQGTALPYFSGNYARRALYTDLLVAAGAWLFTIGAYWQFAGGY